MNASLGVVLFDASSLNNFAVVGRLDLLETHYGGRAQWTATVKSEVERGLRDEPRLKAILDASWLGEPIEISGKPSELFEIDRLRRGLGGAVGNPREHLGEAEMLFYLRKNASRRGLFVSDDRPALDFAARNGIAVIDTPRVLAECYSYGEIGCPDAYELLEEMVDENRGVFLPPDHSHVCP